MKQGQDLIEALKSLIEPMVAEDGFELYDIKFNSGAKILQVFVDSPKGITLDECSKVSRKISLVLDVEDPIPGRYSLEVSSPGIFRELKQEKDFLRYQGARVKLKLREAQEGGNSLIGTLGPADAEKLELKTGETSLEINRSNIKKIQLFPDI